MRDLITPGEWQVSAGNMLRVVVKGTGIVICGVHRIGKFTGRDTQSEANARLIAAAPRMLVALKDALKYSDPVTDPDGYQSLKEAIDLAEGNHG